MGALLSGILCTCAVLDRNWLAQRRKELHGVQFFTGKSTPPEDAEEQVQFFTRVAGAKEQSHYTCAVFYGLGTRRQDACGTDRQDAGGPQNVCGC